MNSDNQELTDISAALKEWAAETKRDAGTQALELHPRIQASIENECSRYSRGRKYTARNIGAAAALVMLCLGGIALLHPRQMTAEGHLTLTGSQQDIDIITTPASNEAPGSLSRPGTLPAATQGKETEPALPHTQQNSVPQTLRRQIAELLAAETVDFASLHALWNQLHSNTRQHYKTPEANLLVIYSSNQLRITLLQKSKTEQYRITPDSPYLPESMRQLFRQAADALK